MRADEPRDEYRGEARVATWRGTADDLRKLYRFLDTEVCSESGSPTVEAATSGKKSQSTGTLEYVLSRLEPEQIDSLWITATGPTQRVAVSFTEIGVHARVHGSVRGDVLATEAHLQEQLNLKRTGYDWLLRTSVVIGFMVVLLVASVFGVALVVYALASRDSESPDIGFLGVLYTFILGTVIGTGATGLAYSIFVRFELYDPERGSKGVARITRIKWIFGALVGVSGLAIGLAAL